MQQQQYSMARIGSTSINNKMMSKSCGNFCRRRYLLRGLVGIVLLIQIVIFFKVTQVHNKDDIGSTTMTMGAEHTETGEGAFDTIIRLGGDTNPAVSRGGDPLPFLTSNKNRPIPIRTSKSTTRKNRLLIGIVSSAGNHMGKVYRNRHRQLFQLWNDTRLCSLHDFVQYQNHLEEDNNELSSSPCQVIYTFVIAGNPNGTTVLLDHNETTPLILPSIPVMPRYKDANFPDVTILNIRENMNHGKTPTYFYFALQVMKEYPNDIHYAMKCDSDAMLRLSALLQFVNDELPILPTTSTIASSASSSSTSLEVPAVLIGSLRHKSLWEPKATPALRRQYEAVWDTEYYNGVHLYLAGQCYALSTRAVELLLDETRRHPLPLPDVNVSLSPDYYEGHEDHDTSSSIVVAATRENITLRWIDMARHYRFWEHPVKGEFWWKKILRRETKKIEKQKAVRANKTAQALTTPGGGGGGDIANGRSYQGQRKLAPPRVLLFLIDSSDPNIRKEHRQVLQKDKRVCTLEYFLQQGTATINSATSGTFCEIVYTFVIGGNPNGLTPSLQLVVHRDAAASLQDNQEQVEHDLLVLNIRENLLDGIVQTLLFYVMQQITEGHRNAIDFVMIAEAGRIGSLDLDGWFRIRDVQLTPVHQPHHHVLVGQIRDTWQQPREFPVRNESFFHQNFDNIHLYLGCECYALSMAVVKGVVQQVQGYEKDPTVIGSSLQTNNHGHDISTFAFFIPKLVIQLVSVTKSQQFWTTRN